MEGFSGVGVVEKSGGENFLEIFFFVIILRNIVGVLGIERKGRILEVF